MELSVQTHAAASLPPVPRYPLKRKLGGPQSRYGRSRGEKNLLLLPGMESYVIQPAVCSLALPSTLKL